jgi:hypothetical protein
LGGTHRHFNPGERFINIKRGFVRFHSGLSAAKQRPATVVAGLC